MANSFSFTQQDGTVVILRETPSTVLRLAAVGSGEPANVKVAKWLPIDKRISNVEIRVSLVDFPRTGLPYALATYRDPIITYALDVGTGSVITRSPTMRYGMSDASSGFFTMPARGAVHRVTGREISVHVRFEGNYPNPAVPAQTAFPWVDVQVSFMPVDAPYIADPPRCATVMPGLPPWGLPQAFPAEASEFRLVTQTGVPYAPNTWKDVVFSTAIGGYLRKLNNAGVSLDRSLFAEWSPITPRMAGWYLASTVGGAFPDNVERVDDDSYGVVALYR